MESKIEIYRQRYETWRHLDKQRWQMVQFLIAIGSGTAVVLRISSETVGGEFWILIGLAVFYIALSMHRVSEAIRTNGAVLRTAGDEIGDTSIPDVSDINSSVGHWLTLVVGGAGIVLIFRGFIDL